MQQDFLPKGIQRACNFGYLHSKCKRLFALLQGAEVRSGPVSGLSQGTGADTYKAGAKASVNEEMLISKFSKKPPLTSCFLGETLYP